MNLKTKKIVITGSNGFVGKNFINRLNQLEISNYIEITKDASESLLKSSIKDADVIFHFAGVNRSEKKDDFESVNSNLTQRIANIIKEDDTKERLVILSSSLQVHKKGIYGESKLAGENALTTGLENTKSKYLIYRFTNIFGKWCRPNYNSVIATFCHNISRGIEIKINDENSMLKLLYIEDLIDQVLKDIENKKLNEIIEETEVEYSVSLGDLANTLVAFNESRNSLLVPDFSNLLVKKLYSTYLSYLPEDKFDYQVQCYNDDRGSLFEIAKSHQFGQIFFSTTNPGVTRGNHYHNTKVEKFIVVKGEAMIRFRHVMNNKVLEYKVAGSEARIVDIPIGYTHSIENIGNEELCVIFCSNEIFDRDNPDTFFEEVIK
ncbi:MAG: hypothetical protein BM556_08895 [Bacteriovorax sp. MedPE-SWde]|nr:MAG: hypothetical protein BM556_08895 [Bacteriovorax sp. MedPE-SWde]